MRRRLAAVKTIGALTATLALTGATTAWSAPPTAGWTSVDLGTLGGAQTEPRDVNDKGQVVGRSQTPDGAWHAFLWQDGVMTALAPDAQSSIALEINNKGDVAGYVQPAGTVESRAVRWSGGTATVLTDVDGYALQVNERGQVAGAVDDPATGNRSPFVWTAGTRVDVGLIPFPGVWPSSGPVDLNKSGTVLGVSETFEDVDVTYVWRDGMFTRIADDVGPFYGRDLNDRGHVVGRTWSDEPRTVAGLWRDGAIERLGTLPGDLFADALALNEKDVVVGTSQGPTPGQQGARGFVWADGTMQPVGVLPGGWSEASEVNDRGQVAGRLGYARADGTQVQQAFVWSSGTLTRLGAELSGVAVADQSGKGHVLTTENGFGSQRAVLWTPPVRRS